MDWVGGRILVHVPRVEWWCFHVLTSTDENRPESLRRAIFVRVGTVLILRTEFKI